MSREIPDTTTNQKSKSHSNSSTDSKPKNIINTKLTWILTPVVLILFLSGLVGITAFTKYGNQSTLSKVLDNLNQHEAAFGVDALTSQDKNNLISTILNDGSSRDVCSDQWDPSTLNQDPIWAVSGGVATEIRPIAEKYNQNTYFAGDFNYNLNLDKKQAYAQLKVDAAADFLEAKRISKEEFETKKDDYKSKMSSDPSDYTANYPFLTDQELDNGFSIKTDGNYEYVYDPIRSLPDNVNVRATGQAIATIDTGYLYLDQLDIETGRFSSNNKLNSWYSQDWEINNTQKEGLSEIIDISKELLETDIDDVISDSTANEFSKIICNNIIDNKVEVLKNDIYVKNIGNWEYSIPARKIVIEQKSYNLETSQEQNKEVLISLLQDDKFKDYMYSMYPIYVRFEKANQKLYNYGSNDNYTILSEEEYRKDIDISLKNYLEELKNNALSNAGEVDILEYISLDYSPTEYYIDPIDMDIVAYSSKYKVTFTQKTLDEMPNYLKPYLNDGFTVTTLVHDIAFNENVPNISIPDSKNSKSVDDLVRDSRIEDTFSQVTQY